MSVLQKLGKRALYKKCVAMFKDLELPACSKCHYFYCSNGDNEVLSARVFFHNEMRDVTLSRNVGSGIFIRCFY